MTTVVKFGGSSLATPAKIRTAAEVVIRAAADGPVAVVVSAMGTTTDELVGLGVEVGATTPSRETDRLLATGELVSAAAFAITLAALGCPARSLSGEQAGIAVAGPPSEGRITHVEPAAVRACFERGEVAVIAGFQGVDHDGELRTLGRGGSDTTAVAIADALGVPDCLIYTDVAGVHSADPRLVTAAQVRSHLPRRVMAEMSFAGAKVMHARAVELAESRNIDIHLRSAGEAGAAGTVIGKTLPIQGLEDLGPTAVAHDLDVARVLIKAPAHQQQLAIEVLGIYGRHVAPIDLVARSGQGETEFRMGFTMRDQDVVRLYDELAALVATADGDLLIDRAVAKVSLVGDGLGSRPALVARMLELLGREGVPTSWISSTPMRISAVVPQDRVADVVRVLHHEFGLHLTPTTVELIASC
jgi:aspartate kinase